MTGLVRHTRLIRYDTGLKGRLDVSTPGRSTAEAVEYGCDLMLAGFVREQLRIGNEVVGGGMVVILTGGDAERMAELLPDGCHVIGDLVFRGLALACPMEPV